MAEEADPSGRRMSWRSAPRYSRMRRALFDRPFEFSLVREICGSFILPQATAGELVLAQVCHGVAMRIEQPADDVGDRPQLGIRLPVADLHPVDESRFSSHGRVANSFRAA